MVCGLGSGVVAGNNIDDAVKVMTRLSKENACFTIDVLGEEISTLEEANFFYEEYVRVVNAIIENKLDANLLNRRIRPINR